MQQDRDPVVVCVALGANLGNAAASVEAAMDALAALPFTSRMRRTGLYCSAPVGASGPDFVNAVVQLSTRLCAPELLRQLQQLELGAGRQRPYPNAPRTLDLDLLLYGDASIDSAALTVPHPRMAQRAFVLLPLSEIAPECVSEAALASVRDQAIERL